MDVDDNDASSRLEPDVKALGSFFSKGLVAWIAKRRLKEESHESERHNTQHGGDYIATPSLVLRSRTMKPGYPAVQRLR